MHCIDVNAYAPEVKVELTEPLRRSQTYRSRRRRPVNSPEQEMLYAPQVRHERLLVTFASDAKAEALAVEYVDRLRPCYEWEGYHDCPEGEASFATAYLAANSDGPFEDYLRCLRLTAGFVRLNGTTTKSDRRTHLGAGAPTKARFQESIRSLLVRAATKALVARGRSHL